MKTTSGLNTLRTQLVLVSICRNSSSSHFKMFYTLESSRYVAWESICNINSSRVYEFRSHFEISSCTFVSQRKWVTNSLCMPINSHTRKDDSLHDESTLHSSCVHVTLQLNELTVRSDHGRCMARYSVNIDRAAMLVFRSPGLHLRGQGRFAGYFPHKMRFSLNPEL